MPDYRAYIVGRDGHFLGGESLSECPDDEAAKNAAQRLVNGHDVELFDRHRLIIRLSSSNSATVIPLFNTREGPRCPVPYPTRRTICLSAAVAL
jgi:hypothetical protein